MTSLEEVLSSINPTGEVEPDGRINCEDYEAYSPAKYPSFKTKRKPKKIAEEPKKKARKTLKLDIPKRGKLQSTLDCWLFKPKATSKVRFRERVLLKEITSDSEIWTTVPLKGFSTPSGSFLKKRQEMKREMKPTPNNVRKTTHILEGLQRENHYLLHFSHRHTHKLDTSRT